MQIDLDNKIKLKMMDECVYLIHDEAKNNCNFLRVDVEEHPQLSENDLEIIGRECHALINNYISKKKYQVLENGSHYLIKNGSENIAKVFWNGVKNSRIKSKISAKMMADRIVSILDNVTHIPIIHKEKECSECTIDSDGSIFARFTKASDMHMFFNKKFLGGFEFEDSFGRYRLKGKDDDYTSIVIYDVVDRDKAHSILIDMIRYGNEEGCFR